MFSVVVCFVALLVTVLLFLWKRKASRFLSLPFCPHWPIVGTVFHLKTDASQLLFQVQDFAKKHDYLYVAWLFFEPVIVIGRADFAEHVLKSQEIITKSFVYNFLHPWLGTGLLTSTHGKWKDRRRALTPTFHFNILQNFQPIFVKHAEILVAKLREIADTNKMIDVQVPVSLATLDIICETAMGVSINAQSNAESEYVNAINNAHTLVQARQRYPWYWPDFIYWNSPKGKLFSKSLKTLHGFTAKVINDRIEERKQRGVSTSKKGKTKAFMDLLLDMYEKGEIDVEGIREEVDTFMFEGHDTTAAGLSWTLYHLGLNPDVQKKLHDEIDDIADQEGDLVEKIKSLKYLECVIKEGLRLHPPVALFARELEKDTEIGGSVYPKGTNLILESISLHTNPEYWDDPLMFKPSRFLEEKFLKRNPYCYVPFSAGPRNCIGQKFALLEEKILLYHIMFNYEVKTVQGEDEIRPCFEIIHKSDNGLGVIFNTRRKFVQ